MFSVIQLLLFFFLPFSLHLLSLNFIPVSSLLKTLHLFPPDTATLIPFVSTTRFSAICQRGDMNKKQCGEAQPFSCICLVISFVAGSEWMIRLEQPRRWGPPQRSAFVLHVYAILWLSWMLANRKKKNKKAIREPAGELQAVLFNLAWPSLGCYLRNVIQKSRAKLWHRERCSLRVKTKRAICSPCARRYERHSFNKRFPQTRGVFWMDVSICAGVASAKIGLQFIGRALPFPLGYCQC